MFVEHTTPTGARGFIGIELKYHEALNDLPARLRPRYEQIATAMAAFHVEKVAELRREPLQQVWRAHLLAGSMLLADFGYATGMFVFLYPRDNAACAGAVQRYGACLADSATFAPWTLEDFIADVAAAGAATLAASFIDRYLVRASAHRERSDRTIVNAKIGAS